MLRDASLCMPGVAVTRRQELQPLAPAGNRCRLRTFKSCANNLLRFHGNQVSKRGCAPVGDAPEIGPTGPGSTH